MTRTPAMSKRLSTAEETLTSMFFLRSFSIMLPMVFMRVSMEWIGLRLCCIWNSSSRFSSLARIWRMAAW